LAFLKFHPFSVAAPGNIRINAAGSYPPMARSSLGMCRVLMLLALAAALPHGATSSLLSSRSPVRRIISMLEMMRVQLGEEGEREHELFDKFMCYCKGNLNTLESSVAQATEKIPQLQGDIEEATSTVAQLTQEIQQHKQDRSDAQDTVQQATAMRDKESAAFEKESTDFKTNIAALGKATQLIRTGMKASFLQADVQQVIRKIAQGDMVGSDDSDALTAFLDQGQEEADPEYQPKSGEIVGILEQLKERMEKDLKDSIASEGKAQKVYDQLMAAKTEEIQSASQGIEEKTKRVGDLKVQLVNDKEDLTSTKRQLTEDSKLLMNMRLTCEAKKKEWLIRQQVRTAEMAAIMDTVKLLNDDAAMNAFNRTMPGPVMLLQTGSRSSSVSKEAIRLIKLARSHGGANPPLQLDLIALALRGKKVGFEKVVQMIDGMIKLLKNEQEADDKKNNYCKKELDKTEDKGKELSQSISDLSSAIEEAEGGKKTLEEEIATLAGGVKALDKQVEEATEQRKEENGEFVKTLAQNHAAAELIRSAKRRMMKFYNLDIAKAPKVEDKEMIKAGNEAGGQAAAAAEESSKEAAIGQLADEAAAAGGGIAGETKGGDSMTTATAGLLDNQAPTSQDLAGNPVDPPTTQDLQVEMSQPPSSNDKFDSAGDATQANDGEVSFLQKGSRRARAPEGFGDYKKQEGHSSVVTMMDKLQYDIAKETEEMKAEEKNSQQEYEEMMKVSSEKRAGDAKNIAEKEGVKADLEETLHQQRNDKSGKETEATNLAEYVKSLHADCDWLREHHGERQVARLGEADSLRKAKAVLAGADFAT